MNRYLIALLATGLLTDIAYAGESTQYPVLQVASLEKSSASLVYKTDVLDKSLLKKTMEDSMRALTLDYQRLQHAVASKNSSLKTPSKVGDKE